MTRKLLRAVGILGVPTALLLLTPADGRSATAPTYDKVRYADGLLSVNDQCPVRGGRLATSIRPVYVNRRPVGFC